MDHCLCPAALSDILCLRCPLLLVFSGLLALQHRFQPFQAPLENRAEMVAIATLLAASWIVTGAPPPYG